MNGFFKSQSLTIAKRAPSLIPKCGACGLYKHCQSPKMPIYGQGKRKILIAGEGPGENEDKQGRQFVGDAGQRLRKVLRKVDIDLDRDCWTTNAIICRATDDKGKNRAPTEQEIDHCQPNLVKAVKELQPEIIIPLGTPAVQSLLSWLWKDEVGGISKWCGWQIPCQSINAWICPTYHPSFCLRAEDPVTDLFFGQHLRAASEKNGRPWKVVPNYNKQVRVIIDDKEAARWIGTMAYTAEVQNTPLAFDYETNCLKPDSKDAKIICCSVSDGIESIAYPWHGRAREATENMIRCAAPKIGSNCKFEARWTRKEFGCRVNNWAFDTMLAAHVLDNRRGITSVKFQAFVLLGAESYDDAVKPYLKSKDGGGNTANRIREVDLPTILRYNALDSLFEWHVAKVQAKMLGMDLFEGV